MDKNVLLITTDLTGEEDILAVAENNGDCLKIIYINHEPLNDIQKHQIWTAKRDVAKIVELIKNTNLVFDYVFTYDEKMIDIIGDISSLTNIQTFNISNIYSRDKYLFKKIMEEIDVPTPKAIQIKSLAEIELLENVLFPVIIKPSKSYGSIGVRCVNNKDELVEQVKLVIQINKFQRMMTNDSDLNILIEEYINGEEYAVDMIWNKGVPIFSGITSRLHYENNNGLFPDYVYFTDHSLSTRKKEQLLEIAKKIGVASNVVNGATHTEIRYKNDKGYVIENAMRPGGGGYIYKVYTEKYQEDIFITYYRTMIGETVTPIIDPQIKNRYYFLYSYISNQIGKVVQLSCDTEKLGQHIEIIDQTVHVKIGDVILPQTEMIRYLMFFIGAIDAKRIEEFKKGITEIENSCYIEVE